MYVIVDERADVADAYVTALRGEGIVALGFGPDEFRAWFAAASQPDLDAVQCFVLGDFAGRNASPDMIGSRVGSAIIALAEVRSLEATLDMFSAGIDDVIRKPVHVREIVARANAIWRRFFGQRTQAEGRLRVFFDGRDPEVDGTPLALPRRERHILEFLVKNAHRRVTKTQIFNAVYGIFAEDVDEVVVEGHVSKLRRKLRLQLGYDVIDAKRYLGYQYVAQPGQAVAAAPSPAGWLESDDEADAVAALQAV